MFDLGVLRATLSRIDGRPYGAYRDLTGSYALPDFTLHVDHVQPDPFAAPSRIRVSVPVAAAGFAELPASQRLPLLDFLLRRLAAATAAIREVQLPPIGPAMLERSALSWEGASLDLRFGLDLPADGRRILGRQAMAILLGGIPEVIQASLFRRSLDGRALRAHIAAYEDYLDLRGQLGAQGWVAFVADGAILPRRHGGSEQPLPAPDAVPFTAPEGLAATITLPHAGEVRGMPVPRGVTLIIGGGYHGKSTLMAALAAGVYPHVPGDGRELVATVADAAAVRVDEGRSVSGVDIAAYVQDAPGVGAGPFSSASASGSTSQAAGIAEALEMGCTCLLIDEDTSAANFLARDARMQALVPPEEEPIVPLCDRLRDLYAEAGVSTVVVVGGHGAFLDPADHVIRMQAFRPSDVTARAREVAAAVPAGRRSEADGPWRRPRPRVPLPESFPPEVRVRPRGRRALQWDERTLDLSQLPQLVEDGQTRAIADLLQMIAARYVDGRRDLAEAVAEAFGEVERAGLAVISPWRGQVPGEYTRPRPLEVAAVLSRLPHLHVAGARPPSVPEARTQGHGGRPAGDGRGRRPPAGTGARGAAEVRRFGARSGGPTGGQPGGRGDRARGPGRGGQGAHPRDQVPAGRGDWVRNAGRGGQGAHARDQAPAGRGDWARGPGRGGQGAHPRDQAPAGRGDRVRGPGRGGQGAHARDQAPAGRGDWARGPGRGGQGAHARDQAPAGRGDRARGPGRGGQGAHARDQAPAGRGDWVRNAGPSRQFTPPTRHSAGDTRRERGTHPSP